MGIKSKPAAPKRTRAAGGVIAGRRHDQQNISVRTAEQVGTERELFDGRVYLGTVRERDDGSFVAVVDEMVIGPFDTITEATDKVLELARPRVAP